MTDETENSGMNTDGKDVEEVLCNLCGLPCRVGTPPDIAENSGLIKASVSGGYPSTPGNGEGALDDGVAYRFSLCEFCCDWLFGKFVIPVAVFNYIDDTDAEPWKPAAERVARDDWRKMKNKFAEESEKRSRAREGTMR